MLNQTNLYLSVLTCLLIYSCKHNPYTTVEIKGENGNIIHRYQFVGDSMKDGLSQHFHENGAVSITEEYNIGVLQGKRTHTRADGSIEIEERYVDGLMEGEYKVYHANGKLKVISQYTGGELTGILKSFDESGIIKEEVNFKNNEENGPFKEFHENGTIRWKGSYLNGDNEFGLLEEYDESGKLIKKMMCDSLALCKTIWTLTEGVIAQ